MSPSPSSVIDARAQALLEQINGVAAYWAEKAENARFAAHLRGPSDDEPAMPFVRLFVDEVDVVVKSLRDLASLLASAVPAPPDNPAAVENGALQRLCLGLLDRMRRECFAECTLAEAVEGAMVQLLQRIEKLAVPAPPQPVDPHPDCPRCHGTGEEPNAQFKCPCRWEGSPIRSQAIERAHRKAVPAPVDPTYHHEPTCANLHSGDCTCDPNNIGYTHGPITEAVPAPPEKEPVMDYEIVQSHGVPEEWRVEGIHRNGDCFVTLFSGPEAELRAREYAAWKAGPDERLLHQETRGVVAAWKQRHEDIIVSARQLASRFTADGEWTLTSECPNTFTPKQAFLVCAAEVRRTFDCSNMERASPQADSVKAEAPVSREQEK